MEKVTKTRVNFMEKMTKTYINFIEKMTKACVCQRFTHKNACGNVNMCLHNVIVLLLTLYKITAFRRHYHC